MTPKRSKQRTWTELLKLRKKQRKRENRENRFTFVKFKKKGFFLLTYVIRRIISQNVPVLGSVRLIVFFSLKDFLKTFSLIYVHKCAVKLVNIIELFEVR